LDTIIETRDLSKSFKNLHAVSGLSFSINKGDVYGFLGQNGAGKSTTMRMLLGLIHPDSGKIFINGSEFNNSRRHLLQHIGAIIERPDMYGYLTGWKNLEIFAALSMRNIPSSRLHAVLEQVGLKGREGDKVKTYSQGMKQRLGIAIALVHEPDLMILDEPTNGLDPQGIADIRELILSLSRDYGKTVLVSSHLLYEIEQVATKMLVMHKGKMIVEGAVKDLLHPDETLVEVVMVPSVSVAERLKESQWQQHLQSSTDATLLFKLNSKFIPDLSKWLVMNGAGILEIRSKHSLEDYFLKLTNDQAT
jgi:ABC-type multidrug transport system ATPase subunit